MNKPLDTHIDESDILSIIEIQMQLFVNTELSNDYHFENSEDDILLNIFDIKFKQHDKSFGFLQVDNDDNYHISIPKQLSNNYKHTTSPIEYLYYVGYVVLFAKDKKILKIPPFSTIKTNPSDEERYRQNAALLFSYIFNMPIHKTMHFFVDNIHGFSPEDQKLEVGFDKQEFESKFSIDSEYYVEFINFLHQAGALEGLIAATVIEKDIMEKENDDSWD